MFGQSYSGKRSVFTSVFSYADAEQKAKSAGYFVTGKTLRGNQFVVFAQRV
jgi:hypothetical protein